MKCSRYKLTRCQVPLDGQETSRSTMKRSTNDENVLSRKKKSEARYGNRSEGRGLTQPRGRDVNRFEESREPETQRRY